MTVTRSPPCWQTEKMDATETMEKTAQMPATAMMVQTMAMTVQMMLTEAPVKIQRTETTAVQLF